MDTNDKRLFEDAFKVTVKKSVRVVVLMTCLGLGFMAIAIFDRLKMDARVVVLIGGAVFLAVAGAYGWHAFSRLPKRFARMLDVLERSPAELGVASVLVRHTGYADGPGAEWTLELVLRDGQSKLRLMLPKKRSQAEALLAVVRARAPHAISV